MDSAYSSPLAKYYIDSINLRKQLIFQELGVPEWRISDPDKTQFSECNKSMSELFSFSPEEALTMKQQLAMILKKSAQKYEDAQEVLNRIKLVDFVFPSNKWFQPVAEGQLFETNEMFAIELKRFQALIQDRKANDLTEEAWSAVEAFYKRLDAAFLSTLPSFPTEFPESSSKPITLENGELFPKSVGGRKICLYELKQKLHRLFQEIGFQEYKEIQYFQAKDGLLVLLTLNPNRVKPEKEYLGVRSGGNVFMDFLIQVAELLGAFAAESFSGQVLCSFSRNCRVSTSAQARIPNGFNSGLSNSRAATQTIFDELSCAMLVYFRKQTSTFGNYETLEHSDASGFLTRICLLPRLKDQNCPKK
ncbi:MAG: hypothetical protein KDD14_13970 [Saprospiraceae bacterium]|nr:hypothetical protein [Saprospiraceae bacterium]